LADPTLTCATTVAIFSISVAGVSGAAKAYDYKEGYSHPNATTYLEDCRSLLGGYLGK
jgi:hypothetical protein